MQGIVTIIADLVKLFASFVANTLKNHWGKILLSIFLTVVFTGLLFPYGDLSSLLSRQIFENTGISARIGNLSLSMAPGPGLKLSKLEVNVAAPPLTMKSASVYPSLFSSALGQDLFFSAEVDGIFGGNVEFSRSPGDTIPEQDHSKEAIELTLTNVKVAEILSTLNHLTVGRPISVPVKLSGQLSLQSEMEIDPQFTVQPEVELALNGQDILLPPQSVTVNFNGAPLPIPLPKVLLSEVRIKGRMVGGDLVIEEAEVGKPGDPLSLKLKGKLVMGLKKVGGGLRPLPGAYEAYVDLSMTRDVDALLGAFLNMVAQDYRKPGAGGQGSRYLFRISGTSFGSRYSIRSTNPF